MVKITFFESGSDQFTTWRGGEVWGCPFLIGGLTWYHDATSFGHFVCLCAGLQPQEIPRLIKGEERLIDQFTNFQPQDLINFVKELAN